MDHHVTDVLKNRLTLSSVSGLQVTTTAYALNTRRPRCTSRGRSNSTLGAWGPGLWWATNTWKWKTPRLPSRPTGQSTTLFVSSGFWTGSSGVDSSVCFQTRHWSEQAGLQSLVRPGSDLRDPQDAFLLFVLLQKGSSAQVWTWTWW